MQYVPSHPQPKKGSSIGRNIGYFLIPPIIVFTLIILFLAIVMTVYQSQHDGRIFTGVSVWGIDLSQMEPAEAELLLANTLANDEQELLTFTDPETGKSWPISQLEVGYSLDGAATAAAAYEIGRTGNPIEQFRDTFQSWYYGRSLAPILVFDEGQLETVLSNIAAEVQEEAVDAAFQLDNNGLSYSTAQAGRELDTADLRQRLVLHITEIQPAEVELLIHDVPPAVYDDPATVAAFNQVAGKPVTFYLREPLDDLDLEPITLSTEELAAWVRVENTPRADGTQQHQFFVDENAFRHWLSQYSEQVHREPVNARYYFNDDTRELVLVAPHINGRELNVEATLEQFQAQIGTGDTAVPLVVDDIVPLAHSNATGVELGITEQITETTTWFYGSTDARKHNIARAAANFFGIVVAPGEEFSFNDYLGSVTENDGYSEGLIIIGGRTIKGIGGGVCQVSTTLYQTAFWAGFPIVERWEHGYMLGYYNDGEGPGMDATVFNPLVDFRFINNTPHHLLIENYYNEENEALTFKFYSTSMGREVVKEEPVFENIVPAPEEDVWEFDPDLEPGTAIQIDWATDGADVTVHRIVYNADGDLKEDNNFVSNYIPWPNVYHYGPDVEPGDYDAIVTD